jgi:H+/gluconate symporter-like permease
VERILQQSPPLTKSIMFLRLSTLHQNTRLIANPRAQESALPRHLYPPPALAADLTVVGGSTAVAVLIPPDPVPVQALGKEAMVGERSIAVVGTATAVVVALVVVAVETVLEEGEEEEATDVTAAGAIPLHRHLAQGEAEVEKTCHTSVLHLLLLTLLFPHINSTSTGHHSYLKQQ